MVVVETTSKNPSYRYAEGGIFSFMETPTYDKPFKSYEELIEIMESRHIIIDDKEFALHALQNFSYYGIVNGYKNTFLQVPGTDDFIEGTNFKELYTLHIIDTSLNNIIFKYILFLEKALKSRLSYLIAQKYGVFTDQNDNSFKNNSDYLYYKNYTNHGKRRINILRSLHEAIVHPRENPMMLHYINKKNHIPPWILTTNISYGLCIEWYNILRAEDKNYICSSFLSSGLCAEEESKEFLRKCFEITKEYRNKIAHGNRTFSISSLPQLPKKQLLALTFNTVSEQEYDNKLGQDDTMAVLLALFTLLNDQYLLSNMVDEIAQILFPYNETTFNGKTVYEIFELPNNVIDRLVALGQRKFS